MFPLSLLSQVSALILLTEHTVTVEEQGRFPECVFWKAGDFCSPLWGGLKDICHVCFQKCLSEMWHPDWHPYREMILSARRIPPPPALSDGLWWSSYVWMYAMSVVLMLSSKMPKVTLGHRCLTATPAMGRLGHFPRIPEQDWGPQRYSLLRSCWSPAECLTLS